ncbi:MAG TPA: Sua5/YciO/YrdC/YwlC family protein, partial [Planctomycetota bacterium]|nr:Sua5/YciO/YrdC/YwlC family protein [Planctomycetota bacterium]
MDRAQGKSKTGTAAPVIARELLVTGVVQGVGFRPFVYRIARQHGIGGTVCNTSEGVRIEIEGTAGQLDAFRRSFDEELPPLAQVTSVKESDRQPRGLHEFTILPSTDETTHEALIPPDVSICRNCLRELHDPSDRRHGYAFINCTDCGPRYTIIVDVPYDRPQTAMADFPMCDDCLRDYRDPADRRFHAEATCCPVCGPRMLLFDNRRNPIQVDDPIAFARKRLAEGSIVAVKGIGGFHLAVDAANADAVEELRRRKGRGLKPFALMAESIEKIKTFCCVGPDEEKLLESPVRPIVLLRRLEDAKLADGVAPFNNYFGVMLPYTPL